ncbi:MAG: methionyl-tRNA formyltransferase [Candidatus Omnitrophota bacterium]|nr:MAG: methionyl-tRNA formyltransferase [Candidatus Omnitrophota bacterium]
MIEREKDKGNSVLYFGGNSVLYFGGNRAGVECLSDLLAWGINIKSVVVRSSDSGVDTWAPSLKKFAREKKLHIFQPEDPNDRQSIEFYRSLHFDYIVSVQYDKILKNAVLSLAKEGAINLHFAPLPRYRGCYPISWAIIEGDAAGVTLHWMDKGIDTGDIICAREIPTEPNKTAREVYRVATDLGREIFREMVPKIFKDKSIRCPQDNKKASYHPRGEPYNRIIDWSWPSKAIDRFVRAFTFPPYAAARTYCGAYEIEIMHPLHNERVPQEEKHPSGTILNIDSNKAFTVQCGDAALKIPYYRLKLDDRYIDSYSEILELTGLKENCILGGSLV